MRTLSEALEYLKTTLAPAVLGLPGEIHLRVDLEHNTKIEFTRYRSGNGFNLSLRAKPEGETSPDGFEVASMTLEGLCERAEQKIKLMADLKERRRNG